MPPALPPAVTAPLTIEIGNVRDDLGVVRVAVCPRAHFLGDNCPFTAVAPARLGHTILIVRDLPPGEYAVQAFHDENNNGKVDRALFGIPREGVGFSRDARISLGPPAWRDAVFSHGGEGQTIRFSLRYFLGAKGPGEPQTAGR